MQIHTVVKAVLAVPIAALILVRFLAPDNLPLYNIILFGIPDPRTPNIEADLQSIRSQGINVTEMIFSGDGTQVIVAAAKRT